MNTTNTIKTYDAQSTLFWLIKEKGEPVRINRFGRWGRPTCLPLYNDEKIPVGCRPTCLHPI